MDKKQAIAVRRARFVQLERRLAEEKAARLHSRRAELATHEMEQEGIEARAHEIEMMQKRNRGEFDRSIMVLRYALTDPDITPEAAAIMRDALNGYEGKPMRRRLHSAAVRFPLRR